MLALERVRNPSKDRQKMEEKEDMVTMSSAGLKGGKEDASASTRSATRSSLSPAKTTSWSINLSSLKSARLRSRLQRVGTARKWSRMGKTLTSCEWKVQGVLRDNYKTLPVGWTWRPRRRRSQAATLERVRPALVLLLALLLTTLACG